MNDLQTYEIIIRQRAEGHLLWQRIGMIVGYLFWVSLWFVFFVRVAASATVLIMAPLSTVLLIFFSWKFVSVEYEYILTGGTFYLTKIYGKRKRKSLLEADTRQALLIAPYTEEYAKQAERIDPDEVLWATSSPSADNVWMLLYRNEEDKKLLLFFEADERSIRLLRYYNPRATARIAP